MLLTLLTANLRAQYSEDQVKAALVYHFCSYVGWPSGTIGDSFKIVVLSEDSTMYKDLKILLANRKLQGKPISVFLKDSIAKNESTQVVLADRSHNRYIKALTESFKGRKILLISDQSQEPLYVMINFIYNRKDGKISYEINSHNIESEGLTYSPDLPVKGGTVLDMKQLYARTYDMLTKEGERLEGFQQQIRKLENQYNSSQLKSKDLQTRMDSMDNTVQLKESQLGKLSEDIISKEKLLFTQAKDLEQQKIREDNQKLRLNSYLRDILHSQNQLDSINFQISEKEKTIKQQESKLSDQQQQLFNKDLKIDAQQKSLRRLIAFLAALALAVSSLVFAYNARRRMNRKLEHLVEKRTQELKESQEYFRNLFENSPVPIIEENLEEVMQFLSAQKIENESSLSDFIKVPGNLMEIIKRTRILNMNENAKFLFKASTKEYLRTHMIETLVSDTHEMLYNALVALMRNEPSFENETIFETFEKSKINVIIRWIVLPGAEQRLNKILVTYTDITPLKKIEIELKRHRDNLESLVKERSAEIISLNEELVSTNDALMKQKKELVDTLVKLQSTQAQLVQAEKMVSLGMLSAGIAHEINNPINFISAGNQIIEMHFKSLLNYAESVTAYTDTITSKEKKEWNSIRGGFDLNETGKAMAEVIQMVSEGINRTTEIIKSLNSYSRSSDDEFTEYDIRNAVSQSLLLLKNRYKSRIEIVQDLQEIPEIKCIPVKVSQVFVNLISNAIDSIKTQGQIKIKVLADAGKNYIITSIQDSGVGIPEKDIEHIYDPFYTTKDVGEGTGLGLYIVYQIMQQHKGIIECNSELGKGTTFTLKWPVKLS